MIIDNFKKSDESRIEENLIHAQQLSGRLLKNSKFILDIHGLEYFQSENLARGFPIYSWKKWAFMYKSKYWKKIERKTFEKALHLICAGESIFEKVKKIQNSTVVRNSLILENFFLYFSKLQIQMSPCSRLADTRLSPNSCGFRAGPKISAVLQTGAPN